MSHPNALKTHCVHGHPYDDENTIHCIRKSTGRPYRKCAACMRLKWEKNKDRWRKPEPNQPARIKRWREQNPEKWAAHLAVADALKDGRLARPSLCERCGKPPTGRGRIEASHDDYDRPLDVEWLCRKCHGAKDRKHSPERVAVTEGRDA